MGYPVLSEGNTWFKSGNLRTYFTKIIIRDSYTPTGEETETWNADEEDSGSIKCYTVGTELVIAGNGSGKISTSASASRIFGRVSATDKFSNVTAIDGLDLLDTSGTKDMSMMFYGMTSLVELDVSNFDTSLLENLQGTFYGSDSTAMSLTSIKGVENFKVDKVTNLYATFGLCANLKALDLSKWKVTNVCTTLRQLFLDCKELKSIGDIRNWDVSNGTDLRNTFFGCENLKEIDLSGWKTNPAASRMGMFGEALRLEKIAVGEGFKFDSTDMHAPSADYIEGADGKWHTIHGDSFTAAELPGNINITYYATEAAAQEDLAKLKQTFVLVDGYTAVGIGDALREKAGTYGDLKPSEWAETIRSI